MKDDVIEKEDRDTEVGIDKPVDPQERASNPLDAVDEDLHAKKDFDLK